MPDTPLGMGSDNDDDPGQGGPSAFMSELAQYRWVMSQEAVNLARGEYDPTVWPNGRMAFEMEQAAAHGHEGLRERVQLYIQDQITEESEDLAELAGAVATSRQELDEADRELAHSLKEWRKAEQELEDDPLEVSRYHRLMSPNTQMLKRALLLIFVLSEFIITGFIFDRALPLDVPLLGYVLALGVMVMLTAIPHFVAQGIKEGITDHHRWAVKKLEDAGEDVDVVLQRMQHREQQDDGGFKIASYVVGGLLVALALPLALLRSSETLKGSEIAWFFLFLIIQLGISGYFFLREWLDHGAPSATLHKLNEQKGLAEDRRADGYQDYADALTDYFRDSRSVFKWLLDAARHDAYIVDCYLESMHWSRHLHTIERPELGVFIHGARQPYLGSNEEVDNARGRVFDPVFDEHRSLEADSPLGRMWALRTIEAATKAAGQSVREDGEAQGETDDEEAQPTRSPAGALIDSLAREWLYDYLREHFDLGPYRPPKFLLEEEADEEGTLGVASQPKAPNAPSDGGEVAEPVAPVIDMQERSASTDTQPSSGSST
jgi:hypothetical protein